MNKLFLILILALISININAQTFKLLSHEVCAREESSGQSVTEQRSMVITVTLNVNTNTGTMKFDTGKRWRFKTVIEQSPTTFKCPAVTEGTNCLVYFYFNADDSVDVMVIFSDYTFYYKTRKL